MKLKSPITDAIADMVGVPEVYCAGFEAKGHGVKGCRKMSATVLNSGMDVHRAGKALHGFSIIL